MKQFLKRAAVLALCLTMILGLTSCGSLSNLIKSGFDASGYIEGILDCTYKGEYETWRCRPLWTGAALMRILPLMSLWKI